MRALSVHALASTDTLIARCIQGERSAWRELHRALQPAASSFLRQMGLAPEDLDDACQDVFVQLFRYLPRFERRAELKTWVYKICISQAARWRRKRVLRTTIARLLGSATPAPTMAASADWTGFEARREMEVALEHMSQRQRTVFVLYELQGFPGEEIARIVDCPPATVRGRLREARLIFSKILAERATEGGAS
jgi:RNA polymerase sigma-70 factor (ECF subfamily)